MAVSRDEAVTPLERVRVCKAALGLIVRRAVAETLTEDEFARLAGRMRSQLNALERDLADEPPIELTDLGASLGRLLDAGLIKPGAELLPGAQRARTYGHLAVIDGDVPFDTPFTGD